MSFQGVVDTAFGPAHLRFDVDGALTDLNFNLQRMRDRSEAPPAPEPWLSPVAAQMADYSAGRLKRFTIRLNPRGTTFQRLAWSALMDIPYGQTATYAEQARRIGKPTACRAVGAANGQNPIMILIPCHRLVGADGGLTGFGGGLPMKRRLLDLERANA